MSKIKIEYEGKTYEIEKGTNIETVIEQYQLTADRENLVVLALVNNHLRELAYELFEDGVLELIDLKDMDGRRTYMRSLTFLMIKAVQELYPEARVQVLHSLSNGFFHRIKMKKKLDNTFVNDIKEKMKEYIASGEKIQRVHLRIDEAIEIYERQNRMSRMNILKYKDSNMVHMYKMGDFEDYYYGYMVSDVKLLTVFDVRLYKNGLVLLGPDVKNPAKVSKFKYEPKLYTIYKAAANWAEMLNITNVADLNLAIEEKRYPELIRLCEAYQEKKICEIADQIHRDPEKGKIILIAGPSSSGKTSFAQRLRLQLMVNGSRPVSISVDDYFVHREDTPLNEAGEKDYESIYAIDLKKFNEDLGSIISGDEVDIPVFNFTSGEREYKPGRVLQIQEDQPVIIEGIHALNPLLTEDIPEGNKFKIYISALTQLSLDEHNKIPTTDLRLIRRMVRDKQFRSYSAATTLGMWDNVRKGEEKNIFPYQENADIMFNSAFIYDLAVLRKYALPLLREIKSSEPQFREAKRLLKYLQYFEDIYDESDIPPTSLLREFIGGSRIV